jgi:hypothetical protein
VYGLHKTRTYSLKTHLLTGAKPVFPSREPFGWNLSDAAFVSERYSAPLRLLVERPEVTDCDPNPPPDGLPGFQGLAVTTDGTVYAAATGCGVVVKISPQGIYKTVLKPEKPWSPTSVAIHAGKLYVLEWTNPNDGPETGWRPRVRKVDRDEKATTLVTIDENVRSNRNQ